MGGNLLMLAGTVRTAIAASVLLGLAITAGYVLQGLFLASALAALFRGSSFAGVAPWIAAFVAVVALRAALVWASEMAAQATAQATKERLRGRLIAKLVELGPGYLQRRQTGELLATVVDGVEALEAYFSRYLPAIFIAAIGCLGVIACLAVVDWRSALILAGFVAALPLADQLWLRWRRPKSSGVFAAMGAFAAYLLDSLQGIVTLKALGAASRRRTALAHHAAELRRESMATLAVNLMRSGFTGLLTLGGIATVLVFNAQRVAMGELAPIALFMTLFLAREAFRPLERLEKEFHTAWSGSGAVAPIAELLDAAPLVRDPALPARRPERFDIAFENVGFSYGQGRAALSSLAFSVAENEFVALVGSSGAGKSTIVSLLLRFFDPQSGAIVIGGTNIRDLSLGDLHALVSVVSQDTYLFHGTIEENLRMARPDASREEIRAAAKAAYADDFIMDLPSAYETPVGERGAYLSGGQRQRIAIARALLKQAPILVLDEATSSVDPASERAIQAALDTLVGQRTTLVIAHRLSSIRKADRILVLDDGRIAEEGRHDDLLQRGGLYARLALAQGETA